MFIIGRRILSAAVIPLLILWMGCTLRHAPEDDPHLTPPYEYEYEFDQYTGGIYFPTPPPPLLDDRYGASWQMFRYYERGRWEYPQLDPPGYRPEGDELRERISRHSQEVKSTQAPTKPTSNAKRTEKVKNRAVKKKEDEKDRREKLRERLKQRRR